MKKLVLFCLCMMCGTLLVQAQQKNNVTISGYIKDTESLETLIGANVFVKELAQGATTNVYGYYAMQIPEQTDSLTLLISYVGYKDQTRRILATEDVSITFQLEASSEVLGEVVITEDVNQQMLETNQMGVQKITSQKIKSIPVVFGETDVLKVIQLMGGVQPGLEGTSGFYVRGGSYDQNLILLDEATVYNPDHFFGFFSTFNSDIVKNLEIYKSDFPARYGGRLSSVLDVQMREGNQREFGGQGGIGLISSRLTLEGPIVKDKSSFVISGRRTYFDIFTPTVNKFLDEDQQIPDYFFYDLNAKVNYTLGPKDRLYLSGYFGRDNLKIEFGDDGLSAYQLKWGNITGTLRWNHNFTPELFSNTTLNISRFNYGDDFNFGDFFFFRSSSEAFTYNLKQDFDYYARNNHNLKFGFQATRHQIRPTEFYFGTESIDPDLQTDPVFERQLYKGDEMALYASDDWKMNTWLSLKFGLRFSGFLTKGNTFYKAIEPRASMNFQVNERTSIKASYARMNQYLHQVKFSNLSFLDPWFPSNEFVAPQRSDQVSAGWNRTFLDGKLGITNEYYYKWMANQLEYSNGAEFLFIDEDYHTRLSVGKGWSYGAELLVEKPEGKLTGWLAYTLSWTKRKFPDLNGGEVFPFTYDRRHVFNAVMQYQLSPTWSLSMNWNYSTGVAIDLASARYFLYGINFSNPTVVPVYGERNSFRMAPSHRLDFGAIKKFRTKGRWESELVISAYNVYSRRNPFFIYYDEVETADSTEENPRTKFVAKQTALFPIIPSVSYNFKF